jgi:murein DD-endopeptidase MepM/ murein hydrolase activator NlpD
MGLALRLLVLLLLPLRAGAEPPQAEAEMRRKVEGLAKERHYRVESPELDRIVAEALTQGNRKPHTPAFDDWLRARLSTALYAFAPSFAVHDDSTRYRLPFELLIPRNMNQGVGGEFSHTRPEDYHAFDFIMPIGTPILAARAGRVAGVIDGFRDGGLDLSLSHKANLVVVLHDDGTFAIYGHLKEGISIREGELVKPGQLLALSGFTGYGVAPHLHFVVRRRTSPTTQESVPILFGPGSREGFVPVKDQWYGALPEPTVELEIRVNGNVIDQMAELPVKRGDTVVLEVARIGRTGERTDVTPHPSTRFVPMTPWSVDVTETGRMSISPAQGFELIKDIDRSHGTVSILHGNRRTGLGIGNVNVSIGD